MDKLSKVCVSGGFDPIHSGHIDLIQFAAKLGPVYVLVNDDKFLLNKKGYAFMNQEERLRIVKSIKGVHDAAIWHSPKNNVADWLEQFKPAYFVNGGDRKPGNLNQEEVDICNKHGIKMVYYGDKIASSSDFVKQLLEKQNERSTIISTT